MALADSTPNTIYNSYLGDLRPRPKVMMEILQVFQQYAGILQQKYPDRSIRGDNFPPGGFRLQAAQILSVIKFLVIMMVLAR